MRGIRLAQMALWLAPAALALAALPLAGAQAGAEPDTAPLESAAGDAEARAGAYADGTQERAGGVLAAWQGYAEGAAAGSAAGTVPAPADETAALLTASGEQGASTVGLGAGASRDMASGSASSAALTVDSVAVDPPLAPDEPSGGYELEAPPEPAGDGSGDAEGTARAGSAPDGAAAEAPSHETANPADPAAEAAVPSVPLPPEATAGRGPESPAPPASRDLLQDGPAAGLDAAVRPAAEAAVPVGAVAAAAMLGLSTALSLAAIARTLAITRSIA